MLIAIGLCACGTSNRAPGSARPPAEGGTGTLIDISPGHGCPDAAAPDASRAVRDGSSCRSGPPVSYARDVRPVFRRCSGEICHDATWGGPDPYAAVVGVRGAECCDGRKLVAPGDPANSYVVQKLRGIDLCAGQQMPLGGSISDADLAILEQWICEGAKEN